jgi:ABC-type transporter Mla MlaB component
MGNRASEPAPTLTLRLDGPVTRAESSRWRDELRAALTGASAVNIDLSGSGPWDLAGVQVLLAAQATARRAGRAVRLLDPPGVLLDLANRAGLSSVLGLPGSS